MMKNYGPTVPSWLTSIALTSSALLLCAVSAHADPPGHTWGSSHGHASYEGHHESSRHGDVHKTRHGTHRKMHRSGYGKHDAKGYGDHGDGAMHPGHHQGAMKFIRHILKFKQGMSLTAEQEQQLHAIKTSYKKARIKMKADVQLARVDMHELLRNDKASLSEIESQMNDVHALMTKLHMADIKAKRDAKAVLTEEQRARMNAIHERMKAHGGSMTHDGGYSKHKKKKAHGDSMGGHN